MFTDQTIRDLLESLPEKTCKGVGVLVQQKNYKDALAIVLAEHIRYQAVMRNSLSRAYGLDGIY